MRSVWLGLALAVACGGGNDDLPAPPETGGSSSGGTRNVTHAGSSSKPDAGAAGETTEAGGDGAGQGGAGDGAGGIHYENAGAPPMFPPGACDPMMKLGSDESEDVGVAAATLLSMTPDELSVALSTGSGGSLALSVADRTSAKGEFVALGVSVPEDYEAASGVSLSSDGLTLILVRTDHSGFGQLTRSARGAMFEADADTTPFSKINSLKPMSGASVGWPVLSSDGQNLYFVSYLSNAFVNQSRRQNGVFDFGTEIDPFTLGGKVGEYKLLSGISADERAIFFFDQTTKHAMALFRSRPGDAPFYDPLDLGDRRGVVPNEDCSRVYSSVASGLVVQAQK
jgi:hypothetical protein